MSDANGQDAGHGAQDIPLEPDEIERLAHSIEKPPEFDQTGRVVRLLITPKDFLPPGMDPMQIIGGHPRGTMITLGTLAGEIHGVEKHEHDWQGKKLESYWLTGYFEAVNAVTGEPFSAPCAALPKAYGLRVAAVFHDPATRLAALGVTVGLKAVTRGAIAYEWFVRDHMQHAAAARVSALSSKLATALLAPGSGSGLKLPGNFDEGGRLIGEAR